MPASGDPVRADVERIKEVTGSDKPALIAPINWSLFTSTVRLPSRGKWRAREGKRHALRDLKWQITDLKLEVQTWSVSVSIMK